MATDMVSPLVEIVLLNFSQSRVIHNANESANSYFSDVRPVEAFFNATAFMQYRNPLGAGPSGKTWPRCASQVLQIVSTRIRKEGPSKRYAIALTFAGWVNDGHPVPDSNLSEASKRTVSQQRQEYIPGSKSPHICELNGRSVPAWRVT
jgi:hypothetical protein